MRYLDVFDDMVLIDEIRDGLNNKLEHYSHTLESREFRLSKLKTKYLKCGFSGVEGGGGKVTMDGVVVLRVEKFKCFTSNIEGKGEINKDINRHSRVGWQKWRNASEVVCNKKILVGLKDKSLLYGCQTSFAIWSRVLANQEDSNSKVNDNRDENDLMDV